MKYFIDTEFLEGPQQKRFFGIPFSKTKPTIDLISIGIVAEDQDAFSKRIGKTDRTYRVREYYAVSKDFNLKEAWNRYQLKQVSGDARNLYPEGVKEYWIREKVLKPIFLELADKRNDDPNFIGYIREKHFTYNNLESLINRYGKTNEQIAKEVIEFVYGFAVTGYPKENTDKIIPKDIQFYAYYADYDWVVFCWLFGNMIDLPKGFPMYCRDLKQMIDDAVDNEINRQCYNSGNHTILNFGEALDSIKKDYKYPKQDPAKAHNALEDARWNKELYNFLNKL